MPKRGQVVDLGLERAKRARLTAPLVSLSSRAPVCFATSLTESECREMVALGLLREAGARGKEVHFELTPLGRVLVHR